MRIPNWSKINDESMLAVESDEELERRKNIASIFFPSSLTLDENWNLLYKFRKIKENGQQTSSNRCCEWTKTNRS